MSNKGSREQIQGVVREMRNLLGNRSGALRRMLNENEKITRETVSAELEVKNYRVAQKRLKEEISRLEKELKQAKVNRSKTDECVRSARAADRALSRKNASLTVGNKKLQKTVDTLKRKNAGLQKSVEKLDATRDKLTADAKRLKELRSRYLSELAKYKKG